MSGQVDVFACSEADPNRVASVWGDLLETALYLC